jgi:1L-myo-inositol 1-phosphate cytidylyltransferase / CDP-L-myo-inositol myo-inositolphosphotransferase
MSHALSNRASIPDGEAADGGAPLLVLVPGAAAARADAAEPVILGLGLSRRIGLAARAAGYRSIVRLSPDHPAAPSFAEAADWRGVADLAAIGRAPAVVIAPTTVLGETAWFRHLAAVAAEARAWAAAGPVMLLPAAIARDALALLEAGGGACDLAAIQDRLIQRFGRPAELPADLAPMVVLTAEDVEAAERHLLRSVVKETDGFMARHVERPISLAISRRLCAARVTPNQMTLVSLAIGLASAPFFVSASAVWQTLGALLLLLHSILDGCDGELARLRFQESRWGGLLDFWVDNIVHSVTFMCMALGWSRASGSVVPLWLGAAAVLGTLGSAGFVYWRVIRRKAEAGPVYTSVSTAPNRPLARLLDALSRRDFIYLVLALALFGKVSWFLLLTAFGAPVFFFLVLVLAWRERTAAASGA